MTAKRQAEQLERAVPQIAAPSEKQPQEDEPGSARVTREQGREFLVGRGYPLSKRYFEKLCLPSSECGPPVDVWFGARALYLKRDLLIWAESRCRAERPSKMA